MANSEDELQIEDVIDFYKRWPEIRPRVTELARDNTLNTADGEILDWMIAVIDRVGPIDLIPEHDDEIQDEKINHFPS